MESADVNFLNVLCGKVMLGIFVLAMLYMWTVIASEKVMFILGVMEYLVK